MKHIGIAVAASLCAWGDSSAPAAQRVEVPIEQTVLSDGEIRYSIRVGIGASDVTDAMLDTGSSGLRLLRDAVPESAYEITAQQTGYHYDSGVWLRGVIANAVISVGGVATPAPVPIQIVQSVGCVKDAPRCPAARINSDDYRIGGNGLPKEGFKAIIGTNMGTSDAVNPLSQIGGQSWIIFLPRPTDKTPGRLIVNPDRNDRSGYTLFRIDEILRHMSGAGGFHDAISGCLTNDKHKVVCGPTLLDTGAPGIHLTSRNSSDVSDLTDGAHLFLVFKNDQGVEVSAAFISDHDRSSKITWALRPNQPRTRIAAGSLPYFAFSVLYDVANGVVGLKAR